MTLLLGVFWTAIFLAVLLPYVVHYFDSANSAHAQPVSAYGKAIVFEWVASLYVAVLWPFGLLPERQRRYVAGGGPPVLLIPGLYLTRSALWLLRWRLKQRGFLNVYTTNHRALLGSIEVIGSGIADELRIIGGLCEGKGVMVIAHGVGGIALRWCLKQYPDLPVEKVITVGTPHQGTKLAVFGLGAAAAQVRPGSAFLADLAASPAATISSIYSHLDSHVIPGRSALFGDQGTEFTDCGSLTLILAAGPADWIAAELPKPY